MNLRRRSVLFLAVVAAALAAYIAVWERRQPGTDELLARRHLLLPGLDRASVERLQLAGAAAPFSLRRQEPGWMIDPDGTRADQGAVDRLLSALEMAEIDRILEPGIASNVMRAGVLHLGVVAAGRTRMLELGERDGTGKGVYARLDGGSVVVTDGRLRDVADRTRMAWRDGQVLSMALRDVSSLEWRLGADGGVMRRGPNGWTDGQGRWLVDERVSLAVTAVLRLRGEQVEASTVPQPGAQERLWLDVRTTAAKTELRILNDGCSGGRPMLLRGGDRLCLDTALPEQVLVAAATPDERLAGVSAPQVTRVVLGEGSDRLALRRGRGGWTLEGASAAPAGAEETERWLEELTEVRGQSSDRPIVWPSSGVRTAVFEVADTRREIAVAKLRGRVFVRRAGEPHVWSAPETLWQALAVDTRTFRPRLLLRLSRFDVLRIAVTGPRQVREVVRRGDEWHQTRPSVGVVEQSALDAALDVVTELRAARFVDEALVSERVVEFDERLPDSVRSPGAVRTRTHRLELGRVTDSGCLARLDGTGPTFSLERDACVRLALDR